MAKVIMLLSLILGLGLPAGAEGPLAEAPAPELAVLELNASPEIKEELHQCRCTLGSVLERIAKNFSDDFAKIPIEN